MGDTYPIEGWKREFEKFAQQIGQVQVDTSASRLDITIKGREEILHASQHELDDALSEFGCNPQEVARYFLRKNGVIIYYQDTLVGYFDIIGYSSFVKANEHRFEDCISRISKFINGACSFLITDIGDVKFNHWVLSDSIILVIDTTRRPLFSGSLKFFMAACSSIMRDGMLREFPLRGAVGGGDFYKDGEIMVSTALVDAVHYEKKQEWLGAVLTQEARRMVEKANIDLSTLSSDELKPCVRYGKIPWKNIDNEPKEAFPEETFYIKPFGMSEKDWAMHLPKHFVGPEKINNSNILYAEE